MRAKRARERATRVNAGQTSISRSILIFQYKNINNNNYLSTVDGRHREKQIDPSMNEQRNSIFGLAMALPRLRRTLSSGYIYVFVTVSDVVTAIRRTPNVDTVSNEVIDREKSAWAVGFVWLFSGASVRTGELNVSNMLPPPSSSLTYLRFKFYDLRRCWQLIDFYFYFI